ncbi:xanthine dehydrogenase family protein subunit M [Paucibacter sp. R3-3]|uniref:Xanthine dehydrogenase family protein subunit M n=1 Tax=Roseateles agri TaxID=3098619 RepID=A0ABU5DLU1_9BURK|nr:xanthine dehydrogenase family protein subunit M [Paucibacter sp. R3-3]MDY0747274.1 xanthine dehydrogenase family protein subunit M [Paucibacter sp. R3-3]
MIPPNFDYHAPKTVGEAITLLGSLGSEAKLLAGGHSLLPMMKLRFAQPAHLIDINRIPELRGIREDAGEIVIGAMTVERELIESKLLQQKLPLLADAPRLIADPQVRNRGTIGGDIAHGDPGNDHPALSIALDATLVLEGPQVRRSVKAESFFHGTYMTDLAEDEILCEIRIAPFAAGTGWAYEKLKRKTGDWATAGAAVVMRMSGGAVASVRIALTNVAPTALRATAAEQLLIGKPLSEAAIDAAAAAAMAIADPQEDLRGDREYKTAMTGQMLKRALRAAAERCH